MPFANCVSPFLVLEHVTRSLVRETLWAACGTCTLLVGEYTPTPIFATCTFWIMQFCINNTRDSFEKKSNIILLHISIVLMYSKDCSAELPLKEGLIHAM